MKLTLIEKKRIPPRLKNDIKKLLNNAGLKGFKEIYISFVGSEEIKRINFKVFKKRKTTDVITLRYDLVPKIGEIFICVDEAKKNAKRFSISYYTELLILITHGLLHLKGYDDKDTTGLKRINTLTLKNLKKLL